MPNSFNFTGEDNQKVGVAFGVHRMQETYAMSHQAYQAFWIGRWQKTQRSNDSVLNAYILSHVLTKIQNAMLISPTTPFNTLRTYHSCSISTIRRFDYLRLQNQRGVFSSIFLHLKKKYFSDKKLLFLQLVQSLIHRIKILLDRFKVFREFALCFLQHFFISRQIGLQFLLQTV